MRLIALLGLVACASGPSYVRDPEGHPLPTSARIDADMEPARVWCGDQEYVIVEPPPRSMLGTHLATHEVHVRDAALLCERIRAFE